MEVVVAYDIEITLLTEAYKRAYESVHNYTPDVEYNNGWFCVNRHGNYRKSQLIAMTNNLIRRAKDMRRDVG
jgi:hypothetical protein